MAMNTQVKWFCEKCNARVTLTLCDEIAREAFISSGVLCSRCYAEEQEERNG